MHTGKGTYQKQDPALFHQFEEQKPARQVPGPVVEPERDPLDLAGDPDKRDQESQPAGRFLLFVDGYFEV